MKNAVIYARFSSHAQNEQSIEGQIRVCTEYADKHGFRIVGSYADSAVSGTRDNRPEFQRMIRDSRSRSFSAVIVYKLDRFARNRYDSAIYRRELTVHGVKLLSAMEQLSDDPTSILLEAMLEASAEYYSRNLAENVRRGRVDSASKGRFVGGSVPFGYRLEEHRLVPDEQTAPILRRVFEMYADGESMKAIDSYIVPLGLRTDRGTVRKTKSFHTAFVNRTYIGEHTQSGVTSECPAIVSAELFDRVQKRLAKNRHTPQRNRAREEFLLTGKLFCGHCGGAMGGSSGKGHGGYYYYYICKRRDKRPERKAELETYVVAQTMEFVLDDEKLPMIADQIVARYADEFGDEKVNTLRKRVDELRREADSLVDELISFSDERLKARIRQRMEETEAQLADAEDDLRREEALNAVRFTREEVMAWLRDFTDGDPESYEYRRRIIDTFVNSVYVYDDKVVIWYNVIEDKERMSLEKTEAEIGSFVGESGPPVPRTNEPCYVFVRGLIGIVSFR